MRKSNTNNLGNRMKEYEVIGSTKLIPLLPIYARLDGRAFHSFCSGLNKPFDLDMVELMKKVTIRLIEETNAVLGYTQSDEISLCWIPTNYKDQIIFNNKKQKLISVLSSIATSEFTIEGLKVPNLKERISKFKPQFDCRVCQLPSVVELTNMLLWRERDAVKNSVNLLAQSLIPHKELQGINQDQLRRLIQEKGQNWSDLPISLQRGTWFKRISHTRELTIEDMKDIPTEYRESKTGTLITRYKVVEMDYPILDTLSSRDRVDTILNGYQK